MLDSFMIGKKKIYQLIERKQFQWHLLWTDVACIHWIIVDLINLNLVWYILKTIITVHIYHHYTLWIIYPNDWIYIFSLPCYLLHWSIFMQNCNKYHYWLLLANLYLLWVHFFLVNCRLHSNVNHKQPALIFSL